MREPVDAVITWVDGYDKQHQLKLESYLKAQSLTRTQGALPTRFNQCGEIQYCVYSLLQYAPWLRTIFIVTDEQIPEFIQSLKGTSYASKIKIIDHKEIFRGFEDFLPTFNSLAIETMLWRIPGLSENFIYLNDDCMLIQPLQYEDFFKDSKLVLRGEWKKLAEKSWFKIWLNKAKMEAHRKLQETSAKLVGYSRDFFSLPHEPFPLKKTTLEDFFQKNPALVYQNIKPAFRTTEQFWTISVNHHLEWQKNSVILDKILRSVYINPSIHSFEKIKARLAKADKSQKTVFACLQSLDLADNELQNYLFSWLSSRIYFL